MRRSPQGVVVDVERGHRVPPYHPYTNMVRNDWFNSTVGLLFALTGMTAGLRGGYSWFDMVNGRPWSNWNLILLSGAIALVVAGWAASHSRGPGVRYRAYVLAVFGCTLLGFFYVPATIVTLRSYLSPNPEVFGWSELAGGLLEPLLVAFSVVVSIVVLVVESREKEGSERS
jgi:hypothetical protein